MDSEIFDTEADLKENDSEDEAEKSKSSESLQEKVLAMQLQVGLFFLILSGVHDIMFCLNIKASI